MNPFPRGNKRRTTRSLAEARRGNITAKLQRLHFSMPNIARAGSWSRSVAPTRTTLLRQSSYRDSSDDPLTMPPLVVGVSCLNLLLVQQSWRLQINVCFHAEWEGRIRQGGSLTCSMIFILFSGQQSQ